MFPAIGGVLVLAVAGLLGYAASRPGSFRIERSAHLKAPPERIFALLEDFHRWSEWSPWEKLDPALKREYGGPERGPGATYHWIGNKQVGEGRMEITGASAPGELTIQLDFIRPFEAHNTTVFTLRPEGDGTHVSWAMNGNSPYMMKVMGVFMDMDRMVGKDFEKGLANLRAAVAG
jgi:carbon monoxide dehydrogenase subunit G